MSTEFEKFIRKNRSDFDDGHPSGKVWKNLEKKFVTKKDAKRFTLRDIYKWSAVAAIFCMTITSVYFLFIKKYSHEIPTVKTGNPESPSRFDNFNSVSIEYAAEFKEASEAVENRQKELRTAIANNPELYKKFQEDLNILDSSYRLLREQAAQSVNGDVLIKAMIQNLQLQSELLGRQLMIIHEFKTTKTPKNEKSI
ncbi:MAG TPA: hypothetical protein VFH08_12995 [Chitinophagaceae bacterium]|nr:hypothetical protein [Chitinophagaceae bacterium]